MHKTYRGDTKTVVVGNNGDGGHFVFHPMSNQFPLKIDKQAILLAYDNINHLKL